MGKILKLNHLRLAQEIAAYYHNNQTDKANKDYFTGHIMRVANKQTEITEMIIAYLHDLLEDTNFAEEKGGFSNALTYIIDQFNAEIALNLLMLKKNNKESYKNYIKRMKYSSKTLPAIRVKLADLEDNMKLWRLNSIKFKDIKRFIKYLVSYIKLKIALFKFNNFEFDG